MKIELTEEEINAIIAELGKMPYKYSSRIIGVLRAKIRER